MKRKIKIVVIAAILLLLGAAYFFGSPYIIGYSFNNLLGTDSSNVTRVFMCQGLSLNNVSTTDKSKIKELIKSVDNRRYTKSLKQDTRYGYTYSYDFYVGNKKIVTITNSEKYVDVNGTYYDIDKPISTDELDKWFQSLPVTKG